MDAEGVNTPGYQLLKACKQSVYNPLTKRLTTGADVNRTDNEGKTALFYAVQEWNNGSVVRGLVDAGADVNRTDNEGRTALFYAVQCPWNNESEVCVLVDAVQQSAIPLLLEVGADLNAKDNYGRTPLFYALTKTNFQITEYLLDRGAHLHPKDIHNVLTFIIEKYYEFPSKIQDLIRILFDRKRVSKRQILKAIISAVFIEILSFKQRSCDIDGDPHLCSLLRLAKDYTFWFDVCPRKAIEKISNIISLSQMGALFDSEMIRTFLGKLQQLHVNPNSVDSDGNTALHHTIQLSWHGVPEENVLYICNELKKMGASFHTKNNKNETPLVHCLATTIKRMSTPRPHQWSEVKTQLSLCQFLIKHGSDVEEKTQNGQSALHLILELLQQVLLHKELRNRSLDDLIRLLGEMVRAYKEKEVSKDNNGNTPLHVWAKLALPPGEDYSITTAEGYTFQGLLARILNDFKENKIGDVNDKNNNGETPLHVCRTWTAVKLLLDGGAKPEYVDSSGRSPLLVAAENGKSLSIPGHFYSDVLQGPKDFWRTAVVEKCLDPWTVDNHGKSVMSILIEAESFDLAKGMIEFAFEDNNPDSAKHVFSLLCAVCKDKSTSAQPKTDLVRIIVESEKCPLSGKAGEDSPLHFCCRNIVKNPNDVDGVHWKIAEMLLLYEANRKILDSSGKSSLNIAEECPELEERLLKPIDINKVPLKIKTWRSISTVHKKKLAYVARGRQSTYVNSYWYHKEDLAHGSFGAVFAGISEKDGREVAIKRIEKIRTKDRREDKREIRNLTSLADCEQVVRYLVFFEDDNFSYIVLELMEGHLDQFLDPAKPMNIKVSLCQDVVKGLKYLHDQRILHRDLKPTNILYKTHPTLCLKIADFGLSRRIDITHQSTSVYGTNAGTRCWIAPEVLTATKYQHSAASDMFSCSLVLHYILSMKKHPFAPVVCANKSALQISHETEANVMNGNMEGWDDSLCPEATHLLKAMLDGHKKKRPSAREALDHPFFWIKQKKLDLLTAVGNQQEFQCPRVRRPFLLSPVETDLDAIVGDIVVHGKWNDARYVHMPAIYTEMSAGRRTYEEESVVELVRFIRNAIAHVSERPTDIREQILEDFVFLDYFPNLVMEVYKAVTNHGWDQTREEIKYVMKK